MKSSLTAVIYLQPDQIFLRIIELPSLKVINDVRSGLFDIGEDGKTANYSKNMAAITDNIEEFKELINDYHVDNVKFYGAYEDMDSVTASYVGDQLKVRTGLQVEWLNNNQLMAQSMSYIVDQLPEFRELSKHNLYILSIGLDSSTLAFFHHGNFETSWEIDLGGAQIHRLVNQLRQTTTNPTEIIQDYIGSKLGYLAPELIQHKRTTMIVQNAPSLSKRYIGKHQKIGEIDRKKFQETFNHLLIPQDRYMYNNDINLAAARNEYILPTYLVITRVSELINPTNLYVTNLSIMDGISNGIATNNDTSRATVNNMIRTSADNIAQRYGIDSKHADFVKKYALQFFDELRPIHRLNNHYRLLLEVAAQVDDIGNFINQQGHYRHSAYILEANPLIGLSDEDNLIIAEVARYHSTESPTINQSHYRHLDDDIQLPVAKLAAILRLVDSLDDSRQQKISRIQLKLKNGRLVVKATSSDDLVLESWSFSQKSQLFNDVFGIEPVLKEKEDR
ncbi:exopolyphosphatase [Limosilactobacillus sp. Sa3CUN2]|uniref:Exopolyphosphatase n=1 Tax=Limosilactobacillus avistercoris TaxID=2762243 RepID=A0ABR8PEJ9_9LACO|nr:exopolyphosphatase [Limosilactobacillus avistercoris]MBD7895719.1 exopolyphosphatase [Limosilactobacillus avistercoris]